MPHPRALYLPGDNPPDLTGMTDRRIRSCLDGSILPDPAELAVLLVAALPGQVPPAAPANPAALSSHREVYEEGIRHILTGPVNAAVGLQLLYSNIQAHTLAAVSPQDPTYGNFALPQITAVLKPFLDGLATQVVNAWYNQSGLRVRPHADVLSLLYDFETMTTLAIPNDQAGLGTAYLTAHPQSAAFQPVLSQSTRSMLTDYLGGLAAVRTALKGAATVPLRGGVNARWSTDPVVEPAPSDHDGEETSLVTEKALPGTVKNIKTGLHGLSNVIAPGVHDQLPTPRFTVVKSAGQDRNIRAYTEAGGVNITIGEPDGPDVVAHEVGHVLENSLPLGCWLDLIRLLHGRHTHAGGGTLVPLHPGSRDDKLSKECAYRAVMPAYPAGGNDRGSYAARVYGGDSPTEVMSTALELLSTAGGAKTLLNQDPQVLAIVLRWLLGANAFDPGKGQLFAMVLPTAP